MIALAGQNLHQPAVLAVLVEALPNVEDGETRRALLTLLLHVDGSRFPSLESFHTALLAVLEREKERGTRTAILQRLMAALHQDERLAPLFLETMAQPNLSDEEQAIVMTAMSQLPAVTSQIAALALRRAHASSTAVQSLALAVAEGCPHWDDEVREALVPYLQTNVDRQLRLRILRHLGRARSLDARFFPFLSEILRRDPDRQARSAALETLRLLTIWDGQATMQLLWTSMHDADEQLRARAAQLLKEAPDLTDEQLEALAGQLQREDAAGARVQLMEIMRGRLSQADLRAAVAAAYAGSPAAFETPELESLLELLAPYVSRDAALRRTLLDSLPRIRLAAQRQRLLNTLLPLIRPDDMVEDLVAALAGERQPQVRALLIAHLTPLSVQKHSELTHAFGEELADPGSPFRLQCATALAAVLESNAAVQLIFEDVLRYDQSRELVRTCLDAYLKPAIRRRFDVLLAVIANESLDLASRQDCLDLLDPASLAEGERARLDEVLASSPARALRLPT